MRILVTGGGGYIGTELVKRLVNFSAVEEVVVYDNLSRGNFNLFLGNKRRKNSKISFVQGDILDTRRLKKALNGIDVVYHLAAKVTTPFANTDPHYYEQINHWGTAELVYAIEESDVKHVIYASSVGVYGATENEVDESSTTNPRTFYGISKIRGEQHVERLNKNIKAHIIRCGNVFGYSPSMRFDAVINKFVFEANFKKRIQIHGDGQQTRSFIHIDKVAAGLVALVDAKISSGVYNFVEHNLKIIDIVDVLKDLIPELEFIFINQDLKLRKIQVKPNQLLNKLVEKNDNGLSFQEEIKKLSDHLRF